MEYLLILYERRLPNEWARMREERELILNETDKRQRRLRTSWSICRTELRENREQSETWEETRREERRKGEKREKRMRVTEQTVRGKEDVRILVGMHSWLPLGSTTQGNGRGFRIVDIVYAQCEWCAHTYLHAYWPLRRWHSVPNKDQKLFKEPEKMYKRSKRLELIVPSKHRYVCSCKFWADRQ